MYDVHSLCTLAIVMQPSGCICKSLQIGSAEMNISKQTTKGVKCEALKMENKYSIATLNITITNV